AHALSETLPASKAAMIILFIDFLQPVLVVDPAWNPCFPAIPTRVQSSNVTKRQAFLRQIFAIIPRCALSPLMD
ncbi:MAG TPA: hypothetical protein VFT07_00345, partial [Sphingomicrobium sp.]|nr:hypothetical protein [Sphingomicrobium sp.]